MIRSLAVLILIVVALTVVGVGAVLVLTILGWLIGMPLSVLV